MRHERVTSRRDIVRGAFGGAVGVYLGGCGTSPRGDMHAADGPVPPAADAGEATERIVDAASPQTDAFACAPRTATPACGASEANPVGPFFRSGAPLRGDLRAIADRGQILIVTGVVMAADCVTPLVDAEIDIWQADTDGAYDHVGFDHRARLRTDACGRYSMTTILPGRYLNGGLVRPSHIHYRVRHPRGRELVTQLYFEGDPFNDLDSFLKRSLVIALTTDPGGQRRGNFDIVLGTP